MRKLICFIILTALSLIAMAQSQVTTTWPYLYADFVQGVITTTAGPQEPALMNIHLAQGRIHYLDSKNNIREASVMNLVSVEMAGSEFIIRDGMLLKVILVKDAGFVVTRIVADLGNLNETGGAYGVSSSTLSTQKLSSIQSTPVNMNHMELMSHRDEGQTIDIRTTHYIVLGGKCIEASKKDVTDYLSEERQKDFKTFLKSHKINWKNAAELEAVLDFMSE